MRVGVLAIQGDFAAHTRTLAALGASAVEVRGAAALEGLDALVIPGGESTAMRRELERIALDAAVRARAAAGLAVLGTCAGAVLMADGLGLVQAEIERNAYGSQLASFIAPVDTADGEISGVFIRAPRFSGLGAGVVVLGRHCGDPVWIAAGAHMATAFHPEWGGEPRVHAAFLSEIAARGAHRAEISREACGSA